MNDHNFLYLNLENTWPKFDQRDKVVIRSYDGALTLEQNPGGLLPFPVEALAGPAGVGIDREGKLYVADPAQHRVLVWDVYTGTMHPLPCFAGEGSAPGWLRTPRGLFVGQDDRLFVADSGNHRVQIVDLDTMQVCEIWDSFEPEPISVIRFEEPWGLAADADGFVYVADPPRSRVQKLSKQGEVQPEFWETKAPIGIATCLYQGEERLLVVDPNQDKPLIFPTDGHYDEDAATWWQEALQALAPIATVHDVLYVGHPEQGLVLTFDRQGQFVGVIQGYPGILAGLSVDRQGRLLIQPPNEDAVFHRPGQQAYVETGTFLAGPFEVRERSTRWQRLEVQAEPLPPGAHLQFYTLTTDQEPDSDTGNGTIPAVPSNNSTPGGGLTPLDDWRAAPLDAFDLLILNEPARYLWLAGRLEGDGTTSPVLHQMRVDYDHESWLRHLPAVYQRDASDQLFLERSLALFESLLGDGTGLIDDLPRLFDPWAAPDDQAADSWLDWLAGWLALSRHADLDELRLRDYLARAVALYPRRGTKKGLEELLHLYLGPDVGVNELNTPFQIGVHSTIGRDTLLDGGAPNFFRVQLALATPDPDAIRKHYQVTQAIVDLEKPAHTYYAIEVEAPTMQLEVQSTLDEDSLLG